MLLVAFILTIQFITKVFEHIRYIFIVVAILSIQ